ncbi:MAG: LacI family DNA-binding transcriptional regulator, partial [Victivallaceae bacterium]|nr:LacI family DNA-binding transcriptional regulator [Victivallaceae bacterium]
GFFAFNVDFNIFHVIIINMEIKNKKSIASIAKKCGVSTMTVSRALRNNALVKDDTRRKIIAIAEELGYIPSPRMGRPSNNDSVPAGKVQLIVGTIGRSIAVFHSQLLTTIEQQLSAHKYECLIRTCSGDFQQFMKLQENIRISDAEATMIIGSFIPEQLNALLQSVPNALLLDNPGLSMERNVFHSSFTFDNSEAARIATRHLLDCGRRRILLLCGEPEHFFSRDIETGYREVMEYRKLKVDKKLIIHSDFTAESACSAINTALDTGLKFDAVFTNDEMASGVYRALLERKIMIPDDIAVCGCDGLPLGMHLFPRLTSVALNYEELGRMAVEYILNADRKLSQPYRVQLLPVLEIRESTGIIAAE